MIGTLRMAAVAAMLLAFVSEGTAWAEAGSTRRELVVDGRAAGASDSNPGTAKKPLATIDAAAQLARPGDTVLVRPGVYREWVRPARGGELDKPIVYRAADPGTVTVKGSDLFTPGWKRHEELEGVWVADLPEEGYTYRNPYVTAWSTSALDHNPSARPHEGPEFPLTIGQVFVDSAFLTQVEFHDQLVSLPGTWMVGPKGQEIWLHLPDDVVEPGDAEIELSVRHRIFSPIRRGLEHIHVRGFVFEHCANQGSFPQAGAVSLRSGSHWLIQNNTIRLANSIGLDVGFEYWEPEQIPDVVPEDERKFFPADNVIRGNVVSDHGLCGIAGINTYRMRIVGNVVERNNTLGHVPNRDYKRWWEHGGIKTHGLIDGLIAGNLIRDNDAPGIWADNAFTGARITRNVILNNLRIGIFVELGYGPVLIDNNLIAYTRMGDGLYAHDASNVTVTHNTLLGNANWGLWCALATDRTYRHTDEQGVQHREPGTHSHWRIRNNLFIANRRGAISLPLEIPGKVEDNRSDHNVFLGGGLFDDGAWKTIHPLFQVNQVHGRRTPEDVAEALKEALTAAEWPREKWPNMEFYRRHLLLSLEMWRTFTGNDRHSTYGKVNGLNLCALSCFLEMKPKEALPTVPDEPDERVTHDLLGEPLREGAAKPGCMQGIEEGWNRLILWPLPTPQDGGRESAAESPAGQAQGVVYPEGSGQFNVRDFGAKGDGKADDTEAFAKAIQAVKRHFQVIYVPDGTYRISDRIAWGNWITLQGQSRDGTVIKLTDDCPGYDGEPKGVVVTAARGPYYGRDARCNAAFSNYVRNLTIDVGRGNPAAVGVRFTTHNHGVVEDVTIRAGEGSGKVGIDLSDTEFGPGMVRNITVEGFDVGVKTPGMPSSCAMENITLKGQRIVGFENHLPVSVRGLVSDNKVPAVRNSGPLAQFVLVDGRLTGGSPDRCAIESDASHYLRNVRTAGYKAALKDNGKVVAGASIEEAVGGRREALFPSAGGHLGLPIKDPPETFREPVEKWVIPNASAEDDTRAVQEAIDSGARTIFLPANVQYDVSDTIVVRGAVRRIIALKHHDGNLRAIDPNSNFADKPMIRVAGGGEPVTIESVHVSSRWTGKDRIEVATSRPVYIKCCWFHGLTMVPESTGDLFLDETGADLRLNPGQNVWIRQYNPENNPFRIQHGGRYKLPRTYVINRGANLWVLSMKTESPAVHVVTLDGGRSEILGGFFRDHFAPHQYRWFGDSPVDGVALREVPYFITRDASLTASYVQFAGGRGNARALQAIEIRAGRKKRLRKRPATFAMGLYRSVSPKGR
jgi:hypothetical protein